MNDLLVDAISNIDNDIIEQYFKTKDALNKKRDKARFTIPIRKWIMVAACFVLIAVSTFVIVKFNINNLSVGTSTNTNSNFAPNTDGIESTWNDLMVSLNLYEALSNGNEQDIFDIVATVSFSIPNDYIYNGKKYSEYLKELKEAKDFLPKANYLVEEGDLLKYGELLYTDGTPNGTKWTKAKYDKIVAYYGEEMLNTYIVNGKFLKEKLLYDIENTENKIQSLENTLNEAKEAIRQSALEKGVSDFLKAGQNATVKDGKISLTITKKDFSNLTIDNKEKYSFSLAFEK